jgi:hypothetical protein
MSIEEQNKINQLKKENDELQKELINLKKKPGRKIGYSLFAFGILFIIISIYISNYIFAFLGIALIFWGALLQFIRPTNFIRKELLESSFITPGKTII